MRCLEEMEAIVDCGELRKFKLTLCQHGLPFKSIAFFYIFTVASGGLWVLFMWKPYY